MSPKLTPLTACTYAAQDYAKRALDSRSGVLVTRQCTALAKQLREAERLLTTHAALIDHAETMEAEYATALADIATDREAMTHGRA